MMNIAAYYANMSNYYRDVETRLLAAAANDGTPVGSSSIPSPSTTPTSVSVAPDAKSPYAMKAEQMRSVQKRYDGVDWMLIRGVTKHRTETKSSRRRIKDDGSEQQRSNEEGGRDGIISEDKTIYSTDDMDLLRVILITKERRDAIHRMARLLVQPVVFDDDGEPITLVTNDSHRVPNAWAIFRSLYYQTIKEYRLSDALNLLFGFTKVLLDDVAWMYDKGGWEDKVIVVKELAYLWKRILVHSHHKLGLDSEFSFPAIFAFLEHFQQKVESANKSSGPNPKLRFTYKSSGQSRRQGGKRKNTESSS